MEGRRSNTEDVSWTEDICLHRAITNMAAFIEELAMKDPPVAVTMRSSSYDREGLYQFRLHRGSCFVDVDMPSVTLEEVRCSGGPVPVGCPRLYVEGNSWWWDYALGIVRGDLEDHDGAVARRIETSAQVAAAELDRQPQCTACGSVRMLAFAKDDLHEVRCYMCDPLILTWRETPGGVVYRDDSWKHVVHFLVRQQHLPPEVPGHDNPMHSDALCGRFVSTWQQGRSMCRLRRRHEGDCEPYWKIERSRVVPDLEGDPLTSGGSSVSSVSAR